MRLVVSTFLVVTVQQIGFGLAMFAAVLRGARCSTLASTRLRRLDSGRSVSRGAVLGAVGQNKKRGSRIVYEDSNSRAMVGSRDCVSRVLLLTFARETDTCSPGDGV